MGYSLEYFTARTNSVRHRIDVLTEWHRGAFLSKEIPLPYAGDDSRVYVTQYDEDDYEKIDVIATNEILSKVVKFARSRGYKVTKKYTDDDFSVEVTLEETYKDYRNIVVTYHADRRVQCKKRVVGTRVIPQREEEIVEWDCSNPVSYLK